MINQVQAKPDRIMVHNPFAKCNTWLYLPYIFITENFIRRW